VTAVTGTARDVQDPDPVINQNHPVPWNELDPCGVCSHALIPLVYAIPQHDDPRGPERPDLKCPGCGKHYRWHARATADAMNAVS
jgi:hypothetical protein